MKRTFTFLFAALFSFIGMWAQVLADGVYTIQADENGKRGYLAASVDEGQNRPVLTEISWSNYAGNSAEAMENSKNWYLTTKNGVSYLYNVAKGAFIVDGGVDEISFGENPFGLNVTNHNNYIHVGSGTGVRFLSMGCGTTAPNQVKWEKGNGNDGGCLLTFTLVENGTTTFATQIAEADEAINALFDTSVDFTQMFRVYNTKSGEEAKAWAPNADASRGALTAYDENDYEQIWQFVEGTGDKAGKYLIYNVMTRKYMQAVGGSNGVALTSNVNQAVYYTAEKHATENKYAFYHDPAATNWLYNDGGGKLAGWKNEEGDHYFTLEVVNIPVVELKKIALQEKVEEAETAYDNLEDKSAAWVVELKDAIDAAKSALENNGLTEEVIDEHIATLEQKKTNAVEYPFIESLVKTIEPDNYYIYYTDESGVKHYLQTAGTNSIVTVTEGAKAYAITAGMTSGGKFSKAYYMGMSNLRISNTNSYGTTIETKAATHNDVWTSQVVFEKDGKCAIRLTNATAVDQWHGNFFIGKGETEGTTIALDPATSLEEAMFIWTLEKEVLVTSVTLNKTEATLTAAGATVELVATVAPDNATDKKVTWSTSDDKVATVDANGVVTAVADGKATITATVGDKTATCEVTVAIVVPVTGVTLNQTEATLTEAGATVELVATVAPENATDKKVTWTTSDDKVATVDENGKVTAVANGTATITATVGDKTATCEVTVAIVVPEVPAIIEWTINPADYPAGEQYKDEAHVINDDLTIYTANKGCHWTTQIRIYQSSSNDGYIYSNKLPAAIKSIAFNAGYKNAALSVYGSNDGATWTKVAELAVATSYKDVVADFSGTAYNYFKVDAEEAQVRIQKMVITLDPSVKLPIVVSAPTFSLSGCNLFAPATVELTAAEGTIYWSTDNETFVPYTEAIAIEASCTVYAYAEVEDTKSAVVTAQYVMAATYDNVAALLAAEATSTGVPVIVKLEAVVDSFGLNKNDEIVSVFLIEGTDTLMVYDYNIPADYVKGSVVKGQLAGLWKNYNGTLELCNVDYSGATVTDPAYDPDEVIEVESIQLNTTWGELMEIGATLQLTAIINPENATNKTITWTSSASYVTVDETGLVTVVAAGQGQVEIKATAANGVSASCWLMVEAFNPGDVQWIQLNKTWGELMGIGSTLQLEVVTIEPADATDKTITWSSDAEFVEVDENGLVTVVAPGEGQVTITATAASGVTANCVLTVTALQVTLNKTWGELMEIGATLQLEATVIPEDAWDKTVTWTSSADFVTVDETGLVTVVAAGQGSVEIKATAIDGASASCWLMVEAFNPGDVQWIQLNKTWGELMGIGSTLQLEVVTIEPADATDKTITWSSDAEFVEVDENGLVTVVAPGEGQVTITATAASGVTANCVLTVTALQVTLNKTWGELMEIGATLQLEATVIPEDAWDKTVTWTSSADFVTVDETGLVTVVAAGQGQVEIKATAIDGASASCWLMVEAFNPGDVQWIQLNKTWGELNGIGATLQLEVIAIEPADATDKTITWSSDADFVTVDETGLVTVVAAGEGMVTITATAASGVTATCVLSVFAEETDGISNITIDANTVIYDLSGRRVTEMTKGIYIVNGVKVIKK